MLANLSTKPQLFVLSGQSTAESPRLSVRNQYCSTNKMNKLRMVDGPLQRYLHFTEIFIDKLNQFREENSNPRLFSVSEGNCGQLSSYWNILQINWEVKRNRSSLGNHSDRNIYHYQLTSSTNKIIISLSLLIFFSFSLSFSLFSSYPSYSLLTLGHCDDACLRSALKSRNCCWY